MLATDGNAGRMNLREAWIAKERAPTMGTPDRSGVGALGVGRKIKDVSVTTGGQNHDIGSVRADRAGYQVASNDAARPAVDQNKVQHLAAGVHLHTARRLLLLERLVRTQ